MKDAARNTARSWRGSTGRERQDDFTPSAESRMREAIRRDVMRLPTREVMIRADRARARGRFTDAIALARELDRRQVWVKALFIGGGHA